MPSGEAYNQAQAANKAATQKALENPQNYAQNTTLPSDQPPPPEPVVTPQNPSGFGYAYGSFQGKNSEFGQGLIDQNAQKGSVSTYQYIKNQTSDNGRPVLSEKDFGDYLTNIGKKGETVDIFASSGAKIGTVKPDTFGKSVIFETLASNPGGYVRESRGKNNFNSKQQREFADYISGFGNQGATIDFLSGGKVVGKVSGPNAYRNSIDILNKNPEGVQAQVEFSTTKEGKTLTETAAKGGFITFSDKDTGYLGFISGKNQGSALDSIIGKSKGGFSYNIQYPQEEKALISSVKQNPAYFEKLPSSFWESEAKSGKISQSGFYEINHIFNDYNREQNKGFIEQNKATASYISGIRARGDEDYYFNIRDSSGKVIGTTKGERSYYDFMKANLKTAGGVSIDAHFSNTLEAAGRREKALDKSTGLGVEAYGEDVNKPQLGGLQAIPRMLESTFGSYGAGIESSFSHLFEANKNAKPIGTGSFSEFVRDQSVPVTGLNSSSVVPFAKDITHTFIPFSLSALNKGELQGRQVVLTPEAKFFEEHTSAPSSLGYLMGKEPKSSFAGKEYYDVQTGFMVYGLLEGVRGVGKATGTGPFKTGLEFKTPVENEFSKGPLANFKPTTYKTEPYYQGFTFFNKPILGKTPGGYVLGSPKPGKAIPEGSIPFAGAERGREAYTSSNLEQSLTQKNPEFFKTLASRNVLALGEKEARAAELEYYLTKEFQEGKVPQKTSEAPVPSSITPEVNLSINRSLSKMQSGWSIFNLERGRTGAKYGSTVTYDFLSPELRPLVGPADIDVHATQTFGFMEESRAINMAKFTQKNILKDLGISPEEGTGFHGTDIESANLIKEVGIDVNKSGKGRGFFIAETSDIPIRLGTKKAESRGKSFGLAKVKFNPKDILQFKKLPKEQQQAYAFKAGKSGKIEERPYYEFQDLLRSEALAQGKKGYSKPYHSTNPNIPSNQYEISILNPKAVKSVDVLTDIQLTERQGRRIYAEPTGKAEGGKALEFITSMDVGKGSSINKSGEVAGVKIDTTKYYQVLPTGERIKTVSGKAQEAGNLSKIGLQDIESAKAQNASPEQLAFFEGGKKVLYSSEAFAGKAIARNYLQHYDFAMDLLKNPATRERGRQIYEANEELLSIRGPYQGITKEDIFTGKYSGPETKAEKQSFGQTFSSIASVGRRNYGGTVKGSILSSSLLSFEGKSGLSSLSSKGGKSGYSLLNQGSSLLGKSGLSSKSGLSGKSGLSSKSSLSQFSGLSGKSGISNKSGLSVKSAIYGFSGLSGTSGLSGSGGTSTSGGKSGLSSFSSFSGKSGISGPSGSSLIVTNGPPPKKFFFEFGFGKKRTRAKQREGPTGIKELSVHNVFSSNLDIQGSRGKKNVFF